MDPYNRTGVGEITTIERPGASSGTTEHYFTKADFEAVKKSLARLDKEFPKTAGALRVMLNKGFVSDPQGLQKFMESPAWDENDRVAMKTVGLEGHPMREILKVKSLAPTLPNGPEVFLRGDGGRPVSPASLQTVTDDLKGVLKAVGPEAKQELKSLLQAGSSNDVKNKELGRALVSAGLAPSDTMAGLSIQVMRNLLRETLAPELKAIAAPAVSAPSAKLQPPKPTA